MWPISLNLIFTSNKKHPSLAHTHVSCQANIHYLVLQHVQSSNAELWRLTKQHRIVFTQLERERHSESASVLFYFLDLRSLARRRRRWRWHAPASNCDEERQQLCYPNKMKPSIKFYHTLLFSHGESIRTGARKWQIQSVYFTTEENSRGNSRFKPI